MDGSDYKVVGLGDVLLKRLLLVGFWEVGGRRGEGGRGRHPAAVMFDPDCVSLLVDTQGAGERGSDC